MRPTSLQRRTRLMVVLLARSVFLNGYLSTPVVTPSTLTCPQTIRPWTISFLCQFILIRTLALTELGWSGGWSLSHAFTGDGLMDGAVVDDDIDDRGSMCY